MCYQLTQCNIGALKSPWKIFQYNLFQKNIGYEIQELPLRLVNKIDIQHRYLQAISNKNKNIGQ